MQPTLINKSAGIIATPTANTTAQQTADAEKQGFNPSATVTPAAGTNSTTAAMGANNLTAVAPVNVPTTSPTVPSGTPVVAPPSSAPGGGVTVDANGYVSAPVNPEKTAINDQIKNYLDDVKNIPTETAQLQTDNNIAGKTTAATNSYNAYNAAKLALQQQVAAMKTQSTGGTTAGTDSAIAEVTRQGNANLANLAIIASADQGNLEAANKIISDKIAAETAPIDKYISYAKDYLEMNPDLSETDKTNIQQKIKDMDAQKQQITNAKTDAYKTAVQNGAPASVLAAIDSATSPAAVYKAMGTYGLNPTDEAYKKAQTVKLELENKKAIKAAQSGGSDSVAIIDEKGNSINVPTDVAPYFNTSANGVNYIDGSTIQGTAADKKSIINQAQAAGLKVILNKNEAADLTNIKDAGSKLDTISTIMRDISQPSALARDLYGYGLTTLAETAQTDPKKAAAGALTAVGLDIFKAISGVQGFRGNGTVIKQIDDNLPKATDTSDTVNTKIQFLQKFINDRETAIVGKPNSKNDPLGIGIGSSKTTNDPLNLGI